MSKETITQHLTQKIRYHSLQLEIADKKYQKSGNKTYQDWAKYHAKIIEGLRDEKEKLLNR